MKVALFWYENAHRYREFQNLYEDANAQHRKFTAWLKDATDLERQLRRDGHEPVRVLTSPRAFRDWCKAHGRSMDASSRSVFAHEQIAPEHRNQDLSQAIERAIDDPNLLLHGPLINRKIFK